MDHAKRSTKAPEARHLYKIAIPFEGDEEAEFRKFLAADGRKAGPYLRVLALEAMRAGGAA